MRVVAALGGNALLERGEQPDAEVRERHEARAAAALAPLLCDHQVIITHGNGPQVGLLAIESAGDPALRRPYPFDALDAQTQGMIGCWLVQTLEAASPGRRAACLICRTLVKADYPAFGQPTKFVGPVYPEAQARRLAAEHGWQIRPDGTAWRRVVPSPEPAALVELDTIAAVADRGLIVVCGGIPLVADDGRLRGVEAVVDKDLTASLMASALGADAQLRRITAAELPPGSAPGSSRPARWDLRSMPPACSPRPGPAPWPPSGGCRTQGSCWPGQGHHGVSIGPAPHPARLTGRRYAAAVRGAADKARGRSM